MMKQILAYAPAPRTPDVYGKRTRVCMVEGKDTDFSTVDTTGKRPSKLISPDDGIDGYVLLDNDTPHASMCFCTECQKTFRKDVDIENASVRTDVEGHTSISRTHYMDDMRLSSEITCPECNTTLRCIGFVEKSKPGTPDMTPQSINREGSSPVDHNGKWVLPPHFVRRQIIESRKDDGTLTAIDDFTLFRRTVIDDQGGITNYGTELGDNIDLVKHERIHTESIIANKSRKTYHAIYDIDPYAIAAGPRMHRFQDASTSVNRTDIMYANAIGAELNSAPAYTVKDDGTLHGDLRQYSMMLTFGGDCMDANMPCYFTDVKAKLLEESFQSGSARKNPVMADSAKNGMYLSQHHRDSDETNTKTDDILKNKIMMMMIRYPVAFDYAVERAENHVIDYEFSQKRRAKEAEEQGRHYEPKEMTEKGKAKFMREELAYVAEQLTVMDKNLRQIVRDSPNTSALRANMASIAFGDQHAQIKSLKGQTKELIEGKHFSIDVEHAKNDPVKSTKGLISKFNRDMFGVTNTIYTAQKMGIRNIDHINALVDIGLDAKHPQQTSLTRVPRGDKVKGGAYAGMIKPIETRGEISFMRSFAKTHDPADVINLYRDEKSFDCYMECVDIYSDAKQKNTVIATADDPSTSRYVYETDKGNVRSYLNTHSVEEAYIGYVSRYGRSSPARINEMIADIKLDKKMPEIKSYADEHGTDAAIEQYRSDFEGTSGVVKSDMPGYIEHFGEPSGFEGKQVVITRNGKNLFKGRSIQDIHDELSTINKHLVDSNEPLLDYYPDSIKAMERSYPNPNGEGEWSFHCHKDSYDVITSSTHLHNCMGNSHVSDIKYGSKFIMYMQDETGQRVAGIELARNYGSGNDCEWKVLQFQGDHDTAVSSTYAGVAKQWLRDCNIEYNHCSDVSNFGKTTADGRPIAFYGENADYHHLEIDPVTGQAANRGDLARREQERIRMAKELFSYDEATDTYNFGVDIPEAP